MLFWLTKIHSISKLFTVIDFHDDVFACNYHLGIVFHSGLIGVFK